jgi:hypothetical protein
MFSGMFGGGQRPAPAQQPNQQEQNQNGNGGGGGGGGGADDFVDQDDDSQYGALAELFAEDENDDDDGAGDDLNPDGTKKTADPNADTPEKKLAAEIQSMLKGFTITPEDLGEDFDVNDPAKFAAAMTAVQRKTAVATMQMAFKPMQQALTQMSADIRTQIQSSLQEFGQGNNARSTLAEVVPEVNDPELSGLVNSLFVQAQKKHGKNAKAAADGVRKALDAMGVKSTKVKRNQTDPSEGASRREGRDALDLYSPLPNRRA